MIFGVFGTAPIPFVRLASALDRAASELREPVVVQHGHTDFLFRCAQAHAFLGQVEMAAHIRDASVVVTHGGWGTISECLRAHKPVVAVPRLAGSEHNHDQDELVAVLERMNAVIAVRDCACLEDAIRRARTHVFSWPQRGEAHTTINNFLRKVFAS